MPAELCNEAYGGSQIPLQLIGPPDGFKADRPMLIGTNRKLCPLELATIHRSHGAGRRYCRDGEPDGQRTAG